MALADPQSVTIGTTPGAVTLPRTDQGPSSGQFLSSDGNVEFIVSTIRSKRARTTVRINLKKVAPDPLTAVNQSVSASVYVVVDRPLNGVFTVTEQKELTLALATWLSASSAANLIKVLGGEA